MTSEPKPSASTLNHEFVTLRLILKTARRRAWIEVLPDMTPPYRGSTKVKRRAWFSYSVYKRLYTATREKVKAAGGKPWESNAKQLHDYVLLIGDVFRFAEPNDMTDTDSTYRLRGEFIRPQVKQGTVMTTQDAYQLLGVFDECQDLAKP